jgi:DNA polymerase III epsilon subunit family exonuclease
VEFRQLRSEDLDSLRSRAHAYFRRVNRPVPSPELARELFATEAPDDAVSPMLIRTLLRRDERFREMHRGTWDLIGARYHHVPLERARFCVVDLEATGSNPRADHVIEVGIVVVQGLQVSERFSTLVQPEVRIPEWIQRLTGIDESTVHGAPRFHQIAPRLVELLRNSIFVAHNVEFDDRFLRAQLRAVDQEPSPWPTLCTVKLARRALRGLDSYRLDALAEHLCVPLDRHHRAVDDAEAAAHILLHALREVLIPRGMRTVGELLAYGRSRPAAEFG